MDADYFRAGNPATPPSELEAMAYEASKSIRVRLAENPSSSLGLLLQLATDSEVDVRVALTENSAAPEWLKAVLAKDESVTVRFALAEDCNTPIDVLKILLEDENPYVVHIAQQTIESVELEIALQEVGFVAELGDCYKLGVMLTMSGLLTDKQIYELLQFATEADIPLGQAVARKRVLPKKVVSKALTLQSRLRRKEITEMAMVEMLKPSAAQGQAKLEISRVGRVILARPA
jgi:hypothetical protein